ILPSSFSSGPRHMYQMLQDSLAIYYFYLKPDLFLTITANGSWPKIMENLLQGNIYIFDTSFISDNFIYRTKCCGLSRLGGSHIRQTLLKKVRGGYYGKVAGLVYTIEYQKRGLPHMHLLIFLK
ncbi:hypothetical protein CY34DRAFT_33067, partial [Suillus luteus UH-Slu-Lm8-n1]